VQDTLSLDAHAGRSKRARLRASVRAVAPTRAEFAAAAGSALLLVCSFPDFDLWPLAWVGLVPLLVAVARRPRAGQSFVLGWTTGALFFYGSCWWLTHSMIHYGRIPAVIAFPLLAPGALVLGLFPALCCFVLARLCARWGARALFLAPPLWVALEWTRLGVTGQLWNALGYSQAYHPALIQTARWGGVYAVSFLIVATNAALAYALLRRTARGALSVLAVILCIGLLVALPFVTDEVRPRAEQSKPPAAYVVAVQPNVSVNFERTPEETAALLARHLTLSETALQKLDEAGRHEGEQARAAVVESANKANGPEPARVVVWPESPMNFTYADDAELRALIGEFARARHAAVLFNSQEPAPAGGAYNSAVLVDAEGRRAAQYDKIRLLPFGEYVPLPRWFPGAWLVSGLVGDFTPGTKYPLIPLGDARGGVFICFESAFPSIARTFAHAGADALVNISNDGYLGRTPVLKQHLANAVFRAAENQRPVLRVTNTGITAYITPHGDVLDATTPFEPAVRTWAVERAAGLTFYTRHGDLFAALCLISSILLLIVSRPWSVGRCFSGET
jgi:apolipoprotein N-acyltransferase